MTELEHKRKQRRKITGEDFTPESLVKEMLDKLPTEVWEDPTKTFCDPAGGSGNFMVEILKRKLQYSHNPLQALSTLFSVELMDDNVAEMKSRLLALLPLGIDLSEAQKILDHNIVCANSLTFDFDNWCKRPVKKAKSLF